MNDTVTPTFEMLGLCPELCTAVQELGYTKPTDIQVESIPALLSGRDVLGQAHTGTGKTAAFALPLLQMLDSELKAPQILVLAPTRELAIQVTEAFRSYATFLPGIKAVAIYGGQSMPEQLRQLKNGAHVVVGTPGRIMDHLRRKTLKLNQVTSVVLDEADEMLNMGFLEDIEWILEKCPQEKRVALFSATMPKPIRKIANKHLNNVYEVSLTGGNTATAQVKQTFCIVKSGKKFLALTRFLAVQPQSDASIIFVKTRALTLEVSDKLATAGFRVAPLNGDLSQSLREQTIEFLKSGKIDIIVATDVAARGLDVERVSQVINFDLPPDMEAYLHRIGRTGRAGRSGSALLLLSERQTPFLDKLERFTKHKLQQVDLPSSARITEQRTLLLKEKVLEYCEGKDVKFFKSIVQEIVAGSHFGIDEIAAAFCYLAQVQAPLRMSDYDDSKVAPMLAETERFAEKKQRRNRGRGRRSEGHHASGGRKRQRGRRRAV